MTDSDIDPEERNRSAARLERELGRSDPVPSPTPLSEEATTEPAESIALAESKERKEPTNGSESTTPASDASRPASDDASFRWAEFVTPARNRGWVHLGSYLLTLLSLALPLLVFHLLFESHYSKFSAADREADYFTVAFWVKVGVFGASFEVAIYLFTFSRRLRAPSALKVMRKNRRPPILLLRAFQDDYAAVENFASIGTWRRVLSKVGLKRDVSFEEVIYDLFSRCGPVVAIGRPGETVPPLGASRFWISDDRWQQAIEVLLKESQRIVMIMGKLQGREGLSWEAKKVLSLTTPEKAVLVLPPVGEESEAQARWESYRELSGDRLAAYQGGELAVGFDSQGACQVVRVKQRRGEYSRDEVVYREAIRVPRRSRVVTIIAAIVFWVLLGLGLTRRVLHITLPDVQKTREAAARVQVKNNLNQLAIAIHNFDAGGHLPPRLPFGGKSQPPQRGGQRGEEIGDRLPSSDERRPAPPKVASSSADRLWEEYGIRVEAVTEAEARKRGVPPRHSLKVCEVNPNSNANAFDLQLNDILLAVEGKPITNDPAWLAEKLDAISGSRPNERITIKVNSYNINQLAWWYELAVFGLISLAVLCVGGVIYLVFRRPRRPRVLAYLDFQK